MRQLRRSLPIQDQHEASRKLWIQFQQSPLFSTSQHIGAYMANDGEIDPGFLIEKLQSHQKQISLPRIDSTGESILSFSPYKPNTKMIKNRFGIDEPVGKTTLNMASIDLILLPLVAFDVNGNRLGMGGGFYDRTFSLKQQSRDWGPKLVGLAHDCQQTSELTTESWDIPLDGILTDQRYIEIAH